VQPWTADFFHENIFLGFQNFRFVVPEHSGPVISDLHSDSALPRLNYQSEQSLIDQIARHYRSRILDQTFKPGTRLPTCLEIGRLIKIAPQTVDRAFDILAREKLVYRRRAVGTMVGLPTPSHPVTKIPKRSPNRKPGRSTVRMIVSRASLLDPEAHLLVVDYLNGFIEGFNVRRCKFEIAYLPPKQTTLEFLHSLQSAGHLQALINMHLEQEATDFLIQQKIPMVCINQDLTRHHVPSVLADSVRGYTEAWSHAHALEHTRVAFLGFQNPLSDRQYECAAGREIARISLPMEMLLIPEHSPTPQSLAAFLTGCLGTFQPLRWPTLIFVQTDHLAIQLLAALTTLGISVPRQISVIGFDDSPAAKNCHPGLTTIAKPRAQMAFAASQLLVDLLERRPGTNNHLQVFPLGLVERETCAPAMKAAKT